MRTDRGREEGRKNERRREGGRERKSDYNTHPRLMGRLFLESVTWKGL